jgi:hypothetical protein
MAQVLVNSAWSIEDLVAESLQAAFGDGDEVDRNVEIGQPEGGLGQVFNMLQVFLNVLAPSNAPEGRDEPDSGIGFDHARSFAKGDECERMEDRRAHPMMLRLQANFPAGPNRMDKARGLMLSCAGSTWGDGRS